MQSVADFPTAVVEENDLEGVCAACVVVAVADGEYCNGCVDDIVEYLSR